MLLQPTLPAVLMFWHGPALSRLERLCMSSFIANGHAVHLHVYDEPARVPPGVTVMDAADVLPRRHLFAHAASGSFALFADWFRYRLLHDKGGLWVDTDVVCLKPFDHGSEEIFAWQDSLVINNAVLGLPTWPQARAMDGGPLRAAKPLRSIRLAEGKTSQAHAHAGTWLAPQAAAMGRVRTTWLHPGSAALWLSDSLAQPFWHFYPIHYLNWHYDLRTTACAPRPA